MGKASLNVLRVFYLASFVAGLLLLLFGGMLRASIAHAEPARQGQGPGFVYAATFKLPITPISAQYFDRLVSMAENDGANALVVQIDTPGGLVDSMQTMVQRILASRVPVIAYVSPQGAMSASAGVFIVYASHVAAMAPNTTIGSSEVIINAGGSDTSGTPETSDAAAERRKATNLLVSLIRSLATERGRNADFGEQAVRQSENYDAQKAADQHVVDFVASNLQDVLNKADGRQVTLGNTSGEKVTVHTKGAEIRSTGTNLAEDLLFLITDPSVAFVLISLGTLGLTWEFINPGAVFPGVVGAILLLTGFLGLGTLPINWAGVIFMALAFVLFIADIFMASHGILTAGGIAALIIGGLLLVNTTGMPGVPTVSPAVVFGVATGLGLFFAFAVYKVVQARMRRPSTGREGLVGMLAETRTPLSPDGMVFVDGELWTATTADGAIPEGAPVRVVKADGLRLIVKRES